MKLLIVKLHALGDLVILSPAIRRLREGFPEARLELLTVNWTAPAAFHNPNVDRVIEVDDSTFFTRCINSLWSMLKLRNMIRSEHYDAAIIFHVHPAIKRFIQSAGIKQRFSFHSDIAKKSRRSVLLDEARHSAVTGWELADLAVRNLNGLYSPEPILDEMRYDWKLTDDELEEANTILKQNGLVKNRYAVIFPGGAVNPKENSFVKRWPVNNYTELTLRIKRDLDIEVVLLGAKSDSSACMEVANNAKVKTFNLSGLYSISTTAAIVKQAAISISNDSGPMHISSAVGTPTVGIFGPTGYRHKLPPGAIAATVGLPCSPCYFSSFKGCLFDSIRCMEELTVEQVMKTIIPNLKPRPTIEVH